MCGPNATQALIPVKTLKLEAGSTIGFAASKMLNNHEHDDFRPVRILNSQVFDFTCLERIMFQATNAHKIESQLLTLLFFQHQFDPAFTIYHDGPATAYMSKAPGELNDYTGDGDWSVILDLSRCSGNSDWFLGSKLLPSAPRMASIGISTLTATQTWYATHSISIRTMLMTCP